MKKDLKNIGKKIAYIINLKLEWNLLFLEN